jgi:4-hydroxy-3-polyprenylbenzoate decarboxylase
MTGASGAVYTAAMLRTLDRDDRVERVHFIASSSALRVLAEELGLSGRTRLAAKLLGRPSTKIAEHSVDDIGAAIASGSYPVDAMMVLPCSMGTLAGIANGLAANLIERAADVTLKERRRLVLCVRETPFNRIHLRNMLLAEEAGATIYPAMPTLYNKPQTTEEMAQQFVDRVLAHIGLPQPDAYQWQGESL